MADAEVSVTVRGSGFDQLAMQAERAEAALKQMGAAVRGTNAAGSAAAKATSDLMKGVNGAAIGTTLGNQIRSSMAAAMGNNSFWQSAFGGMGNRFKTFGQTLGRSMALGVQSALGSLRNVSETDLIGGALIGGMAFKGVEDLVQAAAQRQGARFRLAATGLVDAGKSGGPQAAALEALARDWSNRYGNISTTEGLEFLKDSLQIFGGTQEIFGDGGKSDQISAEGREAMTRIAGLMSYSKAYQAATGKGGDTEAVIGQFAAAIRSGEIKGVGGNATDLANWVEKLTKVQLSTGVDPTVFLQAQRAAGVSFLTMNDDAIYKFAAMTQEQSSRAGVMAATSFMHMVAGNSQTMRGNEAMRSLGLFGDDAHLKELEKQGLVEFNKQGQLKHIDPSIIPNGDDFAKDQYKWYADTLYPAIRQQLLKQNGVDIGDTTKPPSQRTLDDIIGIMRQLGADFKNRNEANQAAESIIQAPQLERRAENIRKAQVDMAAATDLIVKQTQDFQAAMSDLSSDVGQTVLPKVSGFLQWLTSAMRAVDELVKAHPDLTGNVIGWGGGALIGTGILSAGLLLTRFLAFPFKALGGLLKGVAMLTAGVSVGVFDLVGGGVAASKLGETVAKVNQWAAASGTVAKIIGSVGRLMSTFSTIFGAYEVGKWAANTERGQAVLETIQKGWNRWSNPNASSHGNAQLEAEARWRSNNLLDPHHWLHPDGAPPSYLSTLIGDRAKYEDFAKNGEWLKHIRPVEHESWIPSGFGGRRNGLNQANGGPAQTGPVPVVITQMPKTNMPPPIINVGGVTVNVTQSNASPGAIGDAAGSFVANKVRNALSDTHTD